VLIEKIASTGTAIPANAGGRLVAPARIPGTALGSKVSTGSASVKANWARTLAVPLPSGNPYSASIEPQRRDGRGIVLRACRQVISGAGLAGCAVPPAGQRNDAVTLVAQQRAELVEYPSGVAQPGQQHDRAPLAAVVPVGDVGRWFGPVAGRSDLDEPFRG